MCNFGLIRKYNKLGCSFQTVDLCVVVVSLIKNHSVYVRIWLVSDVLHYVVDAIAVEIPFVSFGHIDQNK